MENNWYKTSKVKTEHKNYAYRRIADLEGWTGPTRLTWELLRAFLGTGRAPKHLILSWNVRVVT